MFQMFPVTSVVFLSTGVHHCVVEGNISWQWLYLVVEL